jgi:hypothetical protein
MADAKPPSGPGPLEDAIFIVGIIIVLVVLWFTYGGAKTANLRGIFIHPPAPVGTGGAYGPAAATSSITTGAHY